MDGINRYEEDEVSVMGFENPRSPISSYNNSENYVEDEDREPPQVPPHLQHTLLGFPASQDALGTLPLPQKTNLNHLYIENREGPRMVVALGNTQRFRSKYVTVVIYKPVRRK
ncbi:SNF1-related protein kinase regulatory subunit beta-3 [Ananas comosus]|uniref:SNF1-related protein kinase regulatory subunit beta-3 n=1 Tax=Ananas comosus TaxID=4615 RepID=A0A199URH2_ANACO|nr:SNF1-related protein kinase regulatory subunit beta-3 [Ananas comosus]